ncbi:MAG: hypothetical protein RL685_48 [Pseudomonadota bacterium]|jgi:hypothetical protein
MKDLLRRRWSCPIGLLLLCAGTGCTDEQSGLFIQGNAAREAPSCSVRAEASTTLLGYGVLDVGLKLDYDASLLVGSQLTPRADKDNLRTETMIAVVEGAEVHLFDDEGRPVVEFTVPASGVILPDDSGSAGYGIINATLIPQTQGDLLRGQLAPGQSVTRVAEVSVFGKTVGGLELESASLRYVIKVCMGCLVQFPPEALSAGVCNRFDQPPATTPCRGGQDEGVDCRLCASSQEICRGG